MRLPIIAGNWKLFNNLSEAKQLIAELRSLIKDVQNVEVVVAPVFTALTTVVSAAGGSSIMVAAQDCFWEEQGAFTGEVAPGMLKDAGCSHVIIGHSERRQYFGETDVSVNRKTKAALAAGLTVLLCVGESLEERESGRAFNVVEAQVRGGLTDIPDEKMINVVIAYEPVWAIGTGKTASVEQAQEMHAFIRSIVRKIYEPSTAEHIRILYGGSVKPENIKGLIQQTDIDGALVGGASLKAETFAAIVCFNS